MPRCPYCDAEYILGEIYCKNCNEDLSILEPDLKAVTPASTEAEDVFTPLSPQPHAEMAQGDDSTRENALNVPHVPPVPAVPALGPTQPSTPDAVVPTVRQTGMDNSSVVPAIGPICSRCGLTNEKDAKYCDGCGTPLGMQCPLCQGPNRPGAKFCQHCGHRLATSSTPSMATANYMTSRADYGVPRRSYSLVLLTKGGEELARFPLREGLNQIGAKSSGEGILPEIDLTQWDNQRVISRRHAVLRVSDDGVTLADCGSTNGTFVDGTKIDKQEVPVNEQNIIKFATLFARVVRT